MALDAGHQIGETGHVSDHNLIDAELIRLDGLIDALPSGTAASNLVNGTAAGQIPVWDTVDARYEPATVEAATATDVPFTPTGTIAATNVQAAIAEVAAEAGGGGSPLSVQDENGTAISPVTLLDFQGAGVTAAAGAVGEVIVTIPGGGGSALPQQRYASGGFYGPGAVIGTLAGALGRLYVTRQFFDQPVTINRIGSDTTASAAGAIVRIGIYAQTADGLPGALLFESADLDAFPGGTAGAFAADLTTPLAVAAGTSLFFALVTRTVTSTFRAVTANDPQVKRADTTGGSFAGYHDGAANGTAGAALPSTFTATPVPTASGPAMRFRVA